MPGNTPAYRTDIFTDNSGKYRWVYELPMLKCFFLLFQRSLHPDYQEMHPEY